jgi:SAM-dependent methyltransferase
MKNPDRRFWESRYRTGKTPWDFGGVPQALTSYLARATPARVLIPGCGSGYEVQAFHEHGWSIVAVDYSPAAIERVPKHCGQVLLADFFVHDFGEQRFEVIYERMFLCSMPPTRWPEYSRRVHELLIDDGKLIGLFLYGHEDEPPPYPLTEADAQTVFARRFARVADEVATDSLPLFAGRERWQVWQKNALVR